MLQVVVVLRVVVRVMVVVVREHLVVVELVGACVGCRGVVVIGVVRMAGVGGQVVLLLLLLQVAVLLLLAAWVSVCAGRCCLRYVIGARLARQLAHLLLLLR